MRKALISIFLLGCFYNGIAFADVSANAVVQGNQGYVMGTPSPAGASSPASDAGTSSGPGPIGAIINAVERLDAWIEKNLW